jgi:hypothetical protein
MRLELVFGPGGDFVAAAMQRDKKKGFRWSALMGAAVVGVVFAIAGAAFADDISNNLDASVDAVAEVMPLTVGGANGTTQLVVVPRNGDDKNGCNLTGGTSLGLSVASSNTSVATVSPSSVTFTSCGDARTLTVTPHSQGATTVAVNQTSNSTGATFNLAPATFTVTVAPPPNTPPQLAVAGVTGGASYNKGSVPAATCQVTDAEDGNSSFPATLSAVTGPYASDGIGEQTASCSYTDGGGLTASASKTYGIVDPSAPSIGYDLVPAAQDGDNDWYVTDVSLEWSVTEPQSPNSLEKTGCVDQSITSDQAATTYSCAAQSAGGSAGPVGVSIKRDATKPTINGAASPAANGAGWNNTNVAVSFACDDNLSGIASCGPDQTLSEEGDGQSATGTAIDNAGNSRDLTVSGINIDKTAPSIEFVGRTPENANGWNNGNVTVEWSCSDTGSGVISESISKTVSGEGANQSATATCEDVAGNEASDTQSGINIDKTAPSISAAAFYPDGSSYDGAWTNKNITVKFTCSDPLSGLATACPADQLVDTESDSAAGTVVSGSVSDNAGNSSSDSVTVYVDKTAPTISGSAAPAANAAGWNNTNVTVSFACDDNLSGIASCGPDQTLSAEGAEQFATGTAVDNAGNSRDATVSGINIDKTAPSIEFVGRTTPNANGWNNGNVTVEWSCSDTGSGVVSESISKTVSDEGASQSATATCADFAGNEASDAQSGINIDKTAPVITFLNRTPANANGWNNGNVAVNWSCSDNGSGVVSDSISKTVSDEGANQSATATCADLAGNEASNTKGEINIDKTPPSVSLVGGPADGASYYFGSVPAAPTCNASDSLSLLDGACSINGYSAAVGPHTVNATAKDKAGNQASDSRSYTVLAWTLKGFYQPVDMGGVLNIVKNGSTVPLKFEIFAGSTELTDTANVKSLTSAKVNCDGTAPTDEIEATATGGTSLRYDATAGQFVYNWQTPKTAGICYRVTMTTQDDSSLVAYFRLK